VLSTRLKKNNNNMIVASTDFLTWPKKMHALRTYEDGRSESIPFPARLRESFARCSTHNIHQVRKLYVKDKGRIHLRSLLLIINMIKNHE